MPDALHRFTEAQAALREYTTRNARVAAARADVVEQDFAEGPTYYFHKTHGTGEPADNLLPRIKVPASVPGQADEVIEITTHAAVDSAGAAIADFYSSDSPGGLFRPGDIDVAIQDQMLQTLDRGLSPDARASCEGLFTVAELKAALDSLARGKAPGGDGIPYELYRAFWEELGPPLCDSLNEAFISGGDGTPSLSDRQRLGYITMIYKGKGARDELGNYRPITLFNSCFRIAAKAIALRFLAPLASVIDITQTAYLPGRWAGDNVLCHMEEIDYTTNSGQTGSIVCLDFAKAFDRLNRKWLMRCLRALGFGPAAVRWVSVLLAGSSARVAFNGWRSPAFPTAGGVGQGSPLSALLYIAAAQPLASCARHLQALGRFQSILLPDGAGAPPVHQHADDTELHARTPADTTVLFLEAVQPFCRASGAKINVGKTRGFMFGAGANEQPFTDTATGIEFLGTAAGQSVTHLGVPIGPGADGARQRKLTSILAAIRSCIHRWSQHPLSTLGRVYVARQCLVSMLSYHLHFIVPSRDTMIQIRRSILGYVFHGNLLRLTDKQGRPIHQLPICDPPIRVLSMPLEDGGVRLPDVEVFSAALLAKTCTRLLEPLFHPWKALASFRLRSDPEVAVWGLGTAILTSSFDCSSIPSLSDRWVAAIKAFRALRVHRIVAPHQLSPQHVLREHLFYNKQICDSGQPLSGSQWSPMAANGVRHVADICRVLRGGHAFDIPTSLPGARIQIILHAKAHDIFNCLPESWQQTIRPLIQSSACGPSLYEVSDATTRHAAPQRTPDPTPASRPLPGPDFAVSPVSTPTAVLSPDSRFVAMHLRHTRSATPVQPIQARMSQEGMSVLAVNPDRSLSSAPSEPGVVLPRPDATWHPCLVASWDPARPWSRARPGPCRSGSDSGLYLVDRWDRVELHASVWGCGSWPLDQLAVRDTAHRMRILNLLANPPSGQSYDAGRPIRPKVWEADWTESAGGGSGIRHLEQRWADTAASRVAAGAQPRGRVRTPAEGGPDAVQHMAAQQAAPRPRLHPMQRAAQRAAQQELAAGRHSQQPQQRRPPPRPPDPDDVTDFARAAQLTPPWASIYSQLNQRRLPRRHRWVALQLLHAALPCAATSIITAR